MFQLNCCYKRSFTFQHSINSSHHFTPHIYLNRASDQCLCYVKGISNTYNIIILILIIVCILYYFMYAATSIGMLIGKILLYSILHKHIDSGVLWHLWLCLLYKRRTSKLLFPSTYSYTLCSSPTLYARTMLYAYC